ncbi:MAG: LacI family DNA-binding transcriptional regulator [Rubricella sp.]
MTLKELAAHLGLSPTTVSRALNGYPEVSPETRARVENAARQLNYTPNMQAQRLARGRSQAIGHVVALHDHQIINPFFAEFIAGASETYSARGYEMVLSVVPVGQEEDVYRTMAGRHTVDGVILHNVRDDDERLGLLDELGLPFVVHGRSNLVQEGYTYLDVANARAFEKGAKHLIELGHRRIGLLNGVHGLSFARRRLMGYGRALEAAGIGLDDSLVHHGEMTEGYGYDAMVAWLDTADGPTAVMTSSILTAFGIARALAERGMVPGREVSILTHDDGLSYMANGAPERPLFTACHSSIRAAGRRCAEMLVEMVENPGIEVPCEVWETEFILGRSTGPVQMELE